MFDILLQMNAVLFRCCVEKILTHSVSGNCCYSASCDDIVCAGSTVSLCDLLYGILDAGTCTTRLMLRLMWSGGCF